MTILRLLCIDILGAIYDRPVNGKHVILALEEPCAIGFFAWSGDGEGETGRLARALVARWPHESANFAALTDRLGNTYV